MFDFDGSKLIIIGIVALLVIGPKDLPRVLRQIGQWSGKLRRMAGDFRGQFMDAMREADLDSIKNEVKGVADTARGVADSARVSTHFDPFGEIRKEVGSIKSDLKSSVSLSPPQPTVSAPVDVASSATNVLSEPIPAAELPAPKPTPPRPIPPPRVLSGGIGSLPKSLPSLGTKSDTP